MANNPRYYALINTERWRRLRRAKLSRDPLCEDCKAKGIIRAATEVHHVTPVLAGMTPSQMARLAYDPP